VESIAFSEAALQSAELIGSRAASGKIDIAIIAPLAFRGVCDLIANPATIPYGGLPGFPVGDAVGEGVAMIGAVNDLSVLFLIGAPAFAVTGDPALMSGPIETLAALGVRCALMLDIAHSVNGDCGPGSLVAVSDHINFGGIDPLIGDPAAVGALDMNEPYDGRLLRRLKLSSVSADIALRDGVLMWFSGPSWQTRAEARVARLLKADLIGCGIAPEAVLARRMKVPFAAIVLVPGYAAGFSGGEPTTSQAQTAIRNGTKGIRRLLGYFLRGG
jgi:purine-nucleoside phosphorylase